ncbi:hypothetical protein [Mycolicibacterium conceptionense]|nr:hypothetical protein [Mycolicibacterium conceptionense]
MAKRPLLGVRRSTGKVNTDRINDPDDPRNELVSERWRAHWDGGGALCASARHPAVSILSHGSSEDIQRWWDGEMSWVEACNLADQIDASRSAAEPIPGPPVDESATDGVTAELEELRVMRETVIAFIDERPELVARRTMPGSPLFWKEAGQADARGALCGALGWPFPSDLGDTCRPKSDTKENSDA